MTGAQPLNQMMNDVARELLGVPNERMSRERDGVLRFGANGSIEVNTDEGWFNDYEANVRGGVLDLIAHKAGIDDHASAFRWLEEHGIKEPSNDTDRPDPVFYEYTDENGEVLFKVERRERAGGKTFLQHGPDGQGGFVCRKGCMQGVRRVLYRLPELIAADPAALIFVCEGEKDADRLAKAGLVATTNPGGAGKFLREFASTLAGRRVVVLEDNDQAGRDHAADVLAKLDGVAAQVAVLCLPGENKSDVSDWLAGGGSAFDLKRLADEALAKIEPELLPLVDLESWAVIAPAPKPFVMAGRIPQREVTTITSAGGGTKSTFGHQLCVAHAAGQPMLGVAVQPGKALYMTAEDDFDRLHWMHLHICRKMKVEQSDLFGKIQLSSVRGRTNNELATFDAQNRIQPAPAFHQLRATIAATGTTLLVLDNVAHLFAGNENDRVHVTAFVNLLYALCKDLGVTVLLIAHPNKSGDTYSGSTAWQNAVRSHLVIEKPDGALNPHERILTVEKANYAKPGEELRFTWHEFALWLDSEIPSDTKAQMDALIAANGENAAFMRCLAQRLAEGDSRAVGPSSGPNYAPTQFEGMPAAKGLKRVALKRAMDRLFAAGIIEAVTVHNKAKGRDVTIIREVARTFPNSFPNASRTLSPNLPEPQPERPRAHTHISKDIYGAGPDGPPPLDDDDLDWSEDGERDD